MSRGANRPSAHAALPGREYRLADVAILLGALVVSVVLVLWAALGVWPFAGSGFLWLLGVLVVAGVHGTLGALLIGTYIEVRNPTWSRLHGVDHVVMLVSVLTMTVADIALTWWLFGVTRSWWRWGYLVLAVLSAVGGGWWSWGSLWPRRRDATPSPVSTWPGFWILSGLLGLGVGVVVAILAVAGSAYYRNHYIAPLVAAPRVPVVDGISGSYVALGDSYSAGEGLRPFLPGTDVTGCDQSHLAYSQRLEFSQGRPIETFRACSGAVVADIYADRASGRPVPPQVDGGIHPDVGLVTLTIGGNDVLFSKIVVACFEEANCLTATFPRNNDGPGPAGVDPGPLATSWAPAAALKVGQDDSALFAHLRRSFPNARIVVVGYPYLFPDGRAGLVPNDCASVLRRFSLTERRGIRRLQDQFNDLIYEEAVAAHLEFVSPRGIWQGHEPCGSKGQYTNSIKPFLSFHNPVDGGTFHPNTQGQQSLAALVACYLDTYPQPPDPFVNGRTVPLDVSTKRLETPAEVGLASAPGFESVPSRCA